MRGVIMDDVKFLCRKCRSWLRYDDFFGYCRRLNCQARHDDCCETVFPNLEE